MRNLSVNMVLLLLLAAVQLAAVAVDFVLA